MLRPPLLGCAAACLCAGCGPVAATSHILAADVDVHRAHAADGDKHALYEVTCAELYLAKAREERGYARYAAATLLADKSAAFAKAAELKAAAERTGGPAGTSSANWSERSRQQPIKPETAR